eukprot:13794633-Alexandrium_andersonii.AAC.1
MEEAVAPQEARVKRPCPLLEVGGGRRLLQLQPWVRGAPREARRPRRAAPKPRGSPTSADSERGTRMFRAAG